MSVLGTGVAAGVAQTAQTAQQVVRQRDKRHTQTAADASRLQDLLETHLRALDEGDEAQTPAQLHIDGQLPEHEGPGPQVPQAHGEHEPAEDEPAPQDGAAQAAADARGGGQLYRHLDIQA